MDGADVIAAIAELQGLQSTSSSAPSSAPPSGAHGAPHMVMRAYIPQATEVHLRHLSPSDPDSRVSKMENFWRKKFESQWSNKGGQAYVSDIFVIGQYGTTAMKHKAAVEQYAQDTQKLMSSGSAISYTFHCTKRACKTGEDNLEINLCNVQGCSLCSIMRGSFQLKYVGTSAGTVFGKGLYSSSDPYKANGYGSNTASGVTKRVALVCSVVTGRIQKLYRSDSSRTGPDPGYDSIEAVPNSAGGISYPETVVFKEEAIIPHALITYDFQQHVKPTSAISLVNGGVYSVVNAQFKTVMDLNLADDVVNGWRLNNLNNQQWIFWQQPTGGWILQNKGDKSKFLGLKPMSTDNRTRLNGVSLTDAVVWEVQPAMNNTFRLAMYDTIAKCVDLSMSDGSKLPGRIWIFDHLQGGENQRWSINYVSQDAGPSPVRTLPPGQSGPTQTPVDGGVYILTNDRYNSALDLNVSNNDVQGWRQHGKPNQNWTFKKSGNGWEVYNESAQKYLGLRDQHGRQNGNGAVAVNYSGRVIWEVQEAMGGSVRIATLDSKSMNLDLSTHDQKTVVLFNHTVNATQQRWFLQRIA